jgi:glycine hydroxymethyltransferase
MTGVQAQNALDRAGITTNKNAIPNDTQPPTKTSGLRIGTPAVTTRGYAESDCSDLAGWICDILDAPADESVLARVRDRVMQQCRAMPVYGAGTRG